MKIATKHNWCFATSFALGLSLILAFGFRSTAQSFLMFLWGLLPYQAQANFFLGELLIFPLFAALFYITRPKVPHYPPMFSPLNLIHISLLPLLLSLGMGYFLNDDSLIFRPHNLFPLDFVWLVLLVPIAEEWLFRGWVLDLIETLWPNTWTGTTYPIPLSILFSSLAFGLWHLQNIETLGFTMGIVQILYTMVVGLWLGIIKWKTQRIIYPILAHMGLNISFLLI